MSYIEGVGDEVTILVTILLAAILIYIAWLSTSVSERPLVRIVVLDRARFQEFLHRFVQRNLHPVQATDSRASEQTAPPDQNVVTENISLEHNESSKSSTTISSETTLRVSPSDKAQAGTGQESSQENDKAATATSDVPVDVQMNVNQQTDVAVDREERILEAPQVTQTFLDSFLLSTRSDGSGQSQPADVTGSQPQHILTASVMSDGANNASSTSSSQPETSEMSSSDEQRRQSSESTNTEAEELLPEGHIRIRLKYLDERQRLVQARPEDTIGQFKRAHFSVEMADNFSVRFIFRGQELREDCSTLQAYHIEDNSVIHCLLSRISQSEQATNHSQPFNLDLGFLMFPLFGLTLGLLWYCRVMYRSYFNAVSTLSLVGISFLFLIALLACWRREERLEHED